VIILIYPKSAILKLTKFSKVDCGYDFLAEFKILILEFHQCDIYQPISLKLQKQISLRRQLVFQLNHRRY